jgi:tetratricopeptide (TPR) repeat protein
MVNRLVTYRILRHDAHENTYTTHPLIRAHYFTLLTQGDPSQTQAAHERIKDYYLSIAGDTPEYPTLDDLRPLIEVVYHASRAGAYDEAWRIYWGRISQRNRFVLPNVLGAWETELVTLAEFFPKGDTSQDPQVSVPRAKRWILNEVGLCLMNLGRLSEASPFYERKNTLYEKTSIGYVNLTELYAYLGELAKSAQVAQQALLRPAKGR